jgi:hypothetical protein
MQAIMKKISQEQIKAVLNLLVKYNIGVQEYAAVEKLFSELPVVEEVKERTPDEVMAERV